MSLSSQIIEKIICNLGFESTQSTELSSSSLAFSNGMAEADYSAPALNSVAIDSLAIHIKPPAVLAHEAAGFHEPLRAAGELAAGDEGDGGVVGVLNFGTSHLQA